MTHALASMLLLLFAWPTQGHAAQAGCMPRVEGGWVRLGPGGMPMLAGFGRIANPCADAVTVETVSSPAFGAVELHESRIVDGISRMREVPALRIPTGGAAQLAPGGLHLMLMRPHAPLQAGATVEVVFVLSDGRRVDGRFEVREAGSR